MKKLFIILPTLLFVGCQQVNNPSATQNDVLNSVTKSSAKKERSGILQDGVDDWMKETKTEQKKEPLAKQKSSREKEIEQDKTKGYLQNLLDKSKTPKKEKKEDTSHLKELNSMPVIGK